jgi:hypothetical protein
MRKLMIAAVAALSLGTLALACEQSGPGTDDDGTAADAAELAPARDNDVTSLEDIAPGFEIEEGPDAGSLDPLGPRTGEAGQEPPGADRRGAGESTYAGDREAFSGEGRRIDVASDEDWEAAEAAETERAGADEHRHAGSASEREPAPARTEPEPARVNFSLAEIEARGAGRTPTAIGVVPAGSVVSVRLDQQLSTSANEVGDAFSATTTQPLLDDAGSVAIPAGALVRGRVLGVDGADADGETSMLMLGFESLSSGGRSYAMRGTVVDAHPERRKPTATRGTAAKVGAGAAVGAILGQIIGKDTEATVIGAAAGAAAGTAIALGTRDVEAVLPAGSAMAIRLDAPLRVSAR